MRRISSSAVVMLVITVTLALLSWFILPDTVILQLTLGDTDILETPKFVAILLPALLSIGGAVFALPRRENRDRDGHCHPLVLSAIGIAVFAIMLAINA